MRVAPQPAPASVFGCRRARDHCDPGPCQRDRDPGSCNIAPRSARENRTSRCARALRVSSPVAARYTPVMMTEGGRGGSSLASTGARARVLLVTGMSGAGRSTALKTLEDMGYEAFDNLPLSLVPALIESIAADARAIAVGADLRHRGFAIGGFAIGGFAIESMLEPLDAVVGRTGRELKVLFVDCDDEPLQRRYTETRRPHPLAGGGP